MRAVTGRGVSIALACRTFQISESCYRYERRLKDENTENAEWLVEQPVAWLGIVNAQDGGNRRTWDFGLCYLYLLIKSKTRLKRGKRELLAVPDMPNGTWPLTARQAVA